MTAKPGRDQLLDHTLKHGLSSAAAWGQVSECLDAETLATWVDGGLDRHQAALTEAHLSNCGQCQELLAALARTLPPAAGQDRSGTPDWRWWLVPLTAAAAAGLWMVVPQIDFTSPPEPAAEFAQAAPAEPIPAPAPVPASPAPPTAAAAPAAEPPRQEPAATAERPRQEEQRKQASAPAAQVAADTAARPSPPPVPAAAAPPPTATRSGAVAESMAVAMPSPPTAPPSVAAPPPVATAAPAAAPAAVPLGQVVSPDSRFRWRYSADGLDRSTDGGATWEQVSEAIGRFVTAGTAPSATVCWLVARGGGVFVTDDGRNFFRARFPEIINLVGITATSRAAAIVTADDGRTFVTSDGGVTWRQQ